MIKIDLVRTISDQTGLQQRVAETAVDAMIAAISDELALGKRVQLAGFLTFEVRTRPERITRNPRTGEPVLAPATRYPLVRPGKALKELVAQTATNVPAETTSPPQTLQPPTNGTGIPSGPTKTKRRKSG